MKFLRIRAAEHKRSAEAEPPEILRISPAYSERHAVWEKAASRLAEFRHRTARRGSPSSVDLLEESRRGRTEDLAGKGA